MNESTILRTACDERWYAHAYAEYLADVAQTTSNFMGSLQEALDTDSLSEADAIKILESHEINPDARFILADYGESTALKIMLESWNRLDSTEPDAVPASEHSVEETFSIIRSTWTQCVISSKAFESFAIDTGDSVSRVSKFLQDVQSHFQIDDSVRDTVAYYQAMINASPDVEGFIAQFTAASGLEEADETDDPSSYTHSDLYQYTGSTPGIALDFSTVNQAVESSVRVVAKTVKGIFGVVVSGAKWLFNKAKKYVVDTVIDPAVCEYLDNGEDNEGYIDGFAWLGEFTPSTTYSHFASGGQISSTFSRVHDHYVNKWIKLKLKVGEFLFRATDGSNAWQCYFKPVAIDVNFFKENYTGETVAPTYAPSDHAACIEEYRLWLSGVMEFIQPLSKEATKDQLYAGLAMSTMLAGSIVGFAFVETWELTMGSNLSHLNSSFVQLRDLSEFYAFEPSASSVVTNKRMITASSGDPTDDDNLINYISWSSVLGVSLRSGTANYAMQTVMTDVISTWALCRNERWDNPTDYTFVPYSNNHASFTPASWRIKSDQEIADTRDKFIEKAILAAVAVAAVVFIGATVIKLSKRAFFKRQHTLGQLDNKMWSGQQLTASERKTYLRYNRRQNASRWLNTGASDPTSSLSNDSQSIIALIQG